MIRARTWWALPALAVAMVLLYLPLAAVAHRSVNAATARQSDAWQGFTLRWYADMLAREDIRAAALNSLIIGVLSTLLATVLGTMLAVALARTRLPRWLRPLPDGVLAIPVVTPDIVIGVALVMAYGVYRQWTPMIDAGLTGLIIAHAAFQVAFVTLVVRSRMQLIGPEQFEAARDLYASTTALWLRVILPQLLPGIVAGALLAFILSLDDFMISFFVATPESMTLPVVIYGQMRMGLSPTIHALSTAVTLTTISLVIAVVLLRGRRPTTRSLP